MRKNRKIRYMRGIRAILRWSGALVLSLLMAGSVFAESAGDEKMESRRGQWVFLLASPDDESECRFFVNPSLGGYEAGADTDIRLTMAIGSKSYEVTLYPSDTRKGWYISEVYDIASSAWKMDYEVTLNITDGGSLLAEETLTKEEVSAAWPEVTDERLKLKRDSAGTLENSEFEWCQWMEATNSPLFEYRIDNQEKCEADLDRNTQKIRIIQAENGGSFSLTAEDPSGSRREAKVDIIVAEQTGMGLTGGIIVIAVIVIIAGIAVVLKKSRKPAGPGPSGTQSSGTGRKISKKQQKIMEAREDVERVRQRIDNLVNNMRILQYEISETGRIAEDRVRQEGPASAYTAADIRKMMAKAESLKEDASYETLRKMKIVLEDVCSQLLKMQGNEKVVSSKNGLDVEDPKKYVDEVFRKEMLSKIEADEQITEALYTELEAVLKTLKEIANHEESPFRKDIDILVETAAGGRQYRCRRVAKDAYGASLPGVFSMDSLRFLSREGSWMTLPEILNHETDVRLFAIDETRVRAISLNASIIEGEKKQRIKEFTYDEDGEILLEDARISLHFR